MKLNLSEDQQLLKESIHRYIRDEYVCTNNSQISSKDSPKVNHWHQMITLGWPAIAFAEKDGGLDGGYPELMITFAEFGHGLVKEPLLANSILAGGAIRQAGTDEQKDRLIGGIIDGSCNMAFAFQESGQHYDFFACETQSSAHTITHQDHAHQNGYPIRLTGKKTHIINAEQATHFIITALDENKNLKLYLVEANNLNPSSQLRTYTTIDNHTMGDLELNSTKAVELGPSNCIDPSLRLNKLDHANVLTNIIQDALFCLCCEALGAMETSNRLTLEYAKERNQFGVSISQFQVLQHRMVDMHIEVEKTRSLATAIAFTLEQQTPLDKKKAIFSLKAQTNRAAKFIGEQAIQIHGAMGMTDELPISHYAKRLFSICQLFANVTQTVDTLITCTKEDL